MGQINQTATGINWNMPDNTMPALRFRAGNEDWIEFQTVTDLERFILLYEYDSGWKEHLLSMDHMRDSIGLRISTQIIALIHITQVNLLFPKIYHLEKC